jgi:hypothetical protein
MIARLAGFCTPRPLPMGAASGITAAQPASSSFFAMMRSSEKYGSTVKPSRTSVRAASSVCSLSGKSVVWSPMTSSLTRSVFRASRASRAVRTASSAV